MWRAGPKVGRLRLSAEWRQCSRSSLVCQPANHRPSATRANLESPYCRDRDAHGGYGAYRRGSLPPLVWMSNGSPTVVARYERPAITDLGSLQELTASGSLLDSSAHFAQAAPSLSGVSSPPPGGGTP